MPLYEYECEAENGRRFEIIQKFSDPILTVCPTCGGPVRPRPPPHRGRAVVARASIE